MATMKSNMNRFTVNPVNIDIPRSRFVRNTRHLTTFDAGQLIPVFVDEVLPGDTFSVDTACVVRITTPIHPVMDNAYMDLYYFFVPNRLVWDHWKEFNGENTEGPWANEVEYEVPQIAFQNSQATSIKEGSVADYMGIPVGVYSTGNASGESVNVLPFRAYALIWNEWFRDQNTQAPIAIPKNDDLVYFVARGNKDQYSDTYDIVTTGYLGGTPLPVAKYHDYFTSALPMPQKGPAVTLSLGGDIPVYPKGNDIPSELQNKSFLKFVSASGSNNVSGELGVSSGNLMSNNSSFSGSTYLTPRNLWADGSSFEGITINSLRQAFQLQKLYERDARGGTRYTEVIKAHFGVTSPDARQQRPEYLGGKRIPISVAQVLQTSSTDDVSPQGNTAAYSLTQDRSSSFTKSFTEHGYIIGLVCVRTEQTYQQGIEKFWSRKRRYDFYDPVFANIGEQPIFNKELYFQGEGGEDPSADNEVFGYQEAYADYRFKPSRISGAFRSTSSAPLDSWHYGVKFSGLPTLSSDFLWQGKSEIDRTLSVGSEVEDQFIADFYFKNICVRPMPVYSIPGLIDHH